MTKEYVWAIDNEGKLTKCTAKPENRGKRNCKHKFHSKPGESNKDFFERINQKSKTNNENNKGVSKEFDSYIYAKLIDSIENEYPALVRIPENEIISGAQMYNRWNGELEYNPDLWYEEIRNGVEGVNHKK